jgi:predicted metal-dependent HD superfamily phosphohydrolase
MGGANDNVLGDHVLRDRRTAPARSSYPGVVFPSRHVSLELPPEVVRDLARRYAEPHRAYHTADHIAEVLCWFGWAAERTGWQEPVAVYLAIVFHDAIYDPLASDNEVRSAALARDAIAASPRTQALIQLTARHATLSPADVKGDDDAAQFLDCDLAILAAPPDRFDEYDAAIAVEYRAVPADKFRAGRGAFLRALLTQPRIFLSELFHAELDRSARDNVSRVLARY